MVGAAVELMPEVPIAVRLDIKVGWFIKQDAFYLVKELKTDAISKIAKNGKIKTTGYVSDDICILSF